MRLCATIKTDDMSGDDVFVHHNTIKSVTDDLNELKFNTAISKLMEYVNYFYNKGISQQMKEDFIKLIAPFAPHISEELWESNGNDCSVFKESWPSYDESKLSKNTMNISIQVNGKLRGNIEVSTSLDKDEILLQAKNYNNVKKHIENKEIIKEIYVPTKIVNLVIK